VAWGIHGSSTRYWYKKTKCASEIRLICKFLAAARHRRAGATATEETANSAAPKQAPWPKHKIECPSLPPFVIGLESIRMAEHPDDISI
jgi:hypothetical protein